MTAVPRGSGSLAWWNWGSRRRVRARKLWRTRRRPRRSACWTRTSRIVLPARGWSPGVRRSPDQAGRLPGPGVLGAADPGFGPDDAEIGILGLAPAAHGGNRTGRIFTGDRSGDVLFAALYRAGLANQPTSVRQGRRAGADGIPGSSPRYGARRRTTSRYRRSGTTARRGCTGKLSLIRPTLRVVVALGAFAWQAWWPAMTRRLWRAAARAAAEVRARRPGQRAGRAGVARVFPRQPAEHLHRTADAGHARRGVRPCEGAWRAWHDATAPAHALTRTDLSRFMDLPPCAAGGHWPPSSRCSS